MGVSRVEELVAFQVAREYKHAVYAVVRGHPSAEGDRRFAAQLRDAASSIEANLAEGFGRRTAGEFRQFLRYSIGSLIEAQTRLLDGVDRRYFARSDCEEALRLGRRTQALLENLQRSLARFTKAGRTEPTNRR
jgi:four helix bundle protein